ncbi:MAG TPA: T9SS type A sorting domain-containing protein [Flavisolibacter sp.]|nr:T9SS type A sorting domain-containing protein [Flavisolibacter sp.]
MVHKLRVLLFVSLLQAAVVTAQTVWSGPSIVFSKPSGANPALAQNQDRITAATWLTRGSSRGLYNAFSEASYTSTSPQNTEWATGSLANYATLIYKPWVQWVANDPPSSVGVQAVLHLKTENIYIGITFLSWDDGISQPGGAFSYQRTTALATVPVKLVGFTATKSNNSIALHWTTASEERTSTFTIERSADGKMFAPLGTVDAAGNSSSIRQYRFVDDAPLSFNFYRLRTTDSDGAISLSPVIAYKMNRGSALLVYPNPATTVLHLQYDAGEPATAQIVDATGKVVRQILLPQGETALTVTIAGLKNGVYWLKIGAETRTFLKGD